MRRTAIALIAAAALLGACTNRGYDAKPVVGPDDPREVSKIPELGDEDGRSEQNCFMIEIWAGGWTTDTEDEGIACMVEDDR